MITSASDDCTIKIWDPRKRGGDAVTTFNNNFQVMAVCFNDTADQVITGGLDNEIKVFTYILNSLSIISIIVKLNLSDLGFT
jgi:Prp8 binding protein